MEGLAVKWRDGYCREENSDSETVNNFSHTNRLNILHRYTQKT